MFNVKWDYPIKRPYISLIIATRGSKCENHFKEVKVILLQMPYISFSCPLLLILRWEITAAAVALFLMK